MKDIKNDKHLLWFYWVFVPLFLWIGYAIGRGDNHGGIVMVISGMLIFPTALAYWILMPLCFRKSSMAVFLGHLVSFGIAFSVGLFIDPKWEEMGAMALPLMPIVVVVIVLLGAAVLSFMRACCPAKTEHVAGESPKSWVIVFIISLLVCSGVFAGIYYLYRDPPEVECRYNLQDITDCLPTDLTPDIINETKPGWCDYVKDKMGYGKLRCRLDKKGPCSYAINKNVVGMDHWKYFGDEGTVLLFESKPGWNQIGGPELLESHGHFGKKGVYVYLIRRGVVYVEETDIPKLKWIPDVKP